MNAQLQGLLREVRSDLGDFFLSADVIGQDGISIAGEAAGSAFNADLAATHISMVMKLAERVTEKLDLGKVTENELGTQEVIALSRPLGDGLFTCCLVAKAEATYGLMRVIMDQYELPLWGALSD